MVSYNGLELSGNSIPVLALRTDVASGTATYYGYAEIGTADSGTAWLITRLATSGSATSLTFAGGNASFDKVWTARTGLTYS